VVSGQWFVPGKSGRIWSLALVLAACAPSLEQQKTMVQGGDLRLHEVTSRAVLNAWGAPTYEYKDFIQFYRLTNGQQMPQFRVPLGEGPGSWDSSVDAGVGHFLAYPDRGQIVGFLEDRLVYAEKLPAETLHEIGKMWKREKQFMPQRAIPAR
jgi:hypothetical protein